MSEDWTPTPPERRRRARLLDGVIVDYHELRVGDVFQSLSPAGELIDPFVDEVAEVYCLVIEPPHQTYEGWELRVEAGPLSELKQALQ